MIWTESHSFWWLFPLLMIFLCVFLCFHRRRFGMAGCCWGGSRDPQRGRRADDRDASRRAIGKPAPAEEAPGVEGLRSTVERLERRLRSLEAAAGRKEPDGGRPSNHP
ncbi:MAG: hypothetical protein P1P84_11500 [Deferrisomatales bacterium]|nr:hypothetical protein [Deferrisomatales bacterium]